MKNSESTNVLTVERPAFLFEIIYVTRNFKNTDKLCDIFKALTKIN